jgi:hypothetical protein
MSVKRLKLVDEFHAAINTIIEKLGDGYAHYSNEGKLQMVAYETCPKSRFQKLRQMRGALKNQGFFPIKSDWGIGWILRVPSSNGELVGGTCLEATHTLYMDENERWSLYEAVPCRVTGNDLDDEKLKTKDAGHSEICQILYAFRNFDTAKLKGLKRNER